MKKIAILQSNYIPWKGVFDMINRVDVFVFFEDVDFTPRDWRTRNKIKSSNGEFWLSVPVKKAPRGTKIYQIEILDDGWQKKHYNSLKMNYSKSKYFKDYLFLLDEIYLQKVWTNLSELNIFIIQKISELLGIKTEFINSKDILTTGTKDDKLLDICDQLNATHYLSGPSAKDYITTEKFIEKNIGLEYIVYDYKEYEQLYGDFNHYVSIFDVLFNCGIDSPKYVFSTNNDIVFKPYI